METFDEIKKMIINQFAVDKEATVGDAHLQDDLEGGFSAKRWYNFIEQRKITVWYTGPQQ